MNVRQLAYLEYTALARLFAVREATELLASNADVADVLGAIRFIRELNSIYTTETRSLQTAERALLARNERRIRAMLRRKVLSNGRRRYASPQERTRGEQAQ